MAFQIFPYVLILLIVEHPFPKMVIVDVIRAGVLGLENTENRSFLLSGFLVFKKREIFISKAAWQFLPWGFIGFIPQNFDIQKQPIS